MITLFSIPKAFSGHFGVIQRNAIQSWKRIGGDVEVILVGDDPGTAEAAVELGVGHIPDVARNEYGTPLLDDVFRKAQAAARHHLVCYINTDIILFDELLAVARFVAGSRRKFLVGGRRWDYPMEGPVDFDQGWDNRLRADVAEKASLHAATGIDYFLFPKGLIIDIPPFAIGRTRFDNWLLWEARNRSGCLVDATDCVTAVHQNHDYSHVTKASVSYSDGPEAARNHELAGGPMRILTLDDCTHRLARHGASYRLEHIANLRDERYWRIEAEYRPAVRLALRAKLAAGKIKRLLIRASKPPGGAS
jgi:hypothetical protein